MSIPSESFMRWNELCQRGYKTPGAINEFNRVMEEIDRINPSIARTVNDARYDICSAIMQSILEPKVDLTAQANDEYEEVMLAEQIIKGLDAPETG